MDQNAKLAATFYSSHSSSIWCSYWPNFRGFKPSAGLSIASSVDGRIKWSIEITAVTIRYINSQSNQRQPTQRVLLPSRQIATDTGRPDQTTPLYYTMYPPSQAVIIILPPPPSSSSLSNFHSIHYVNRKNIFSSQSSALNLKAIRSLDENRDLRWF